MPARSWRTIDRRTDEVQLLEALRSNRQKRERQRRFVVEGVRNIDAALAAGWTVHAVLAPEGATLSRWAGEVVDRAMDADLLRLAPDVFDLLTDRDERPELLLVVAIPHRVLDEVPRSPTSLAVVLDRIASPGNLGTIVRTADAFGADSVVIVGHAASPWDPQAVRASTGSLFAVPVVAADGPAELEEWCRRRSMTIVATDEGAEVDIADAELRRPCALLLGNESTGLSRALLDLADVTVRIPIGGTASSLNIAVAAGIALHELARRPPS
jgi:tRNA G18 (ribose-2'-O)-methylase SpoU